MTDAFPGSNYEKGYRKKRLNEVVDKHYPKLVKLATEEEAMRESLEELNRAVQQERADVGMFRIVSSIPPRQRLWLLRLVMHLPEYVSKAKMCATLNRAKIKGMEAIEGKLFSKSKSSKDKEPARGRRLTREDKHAGRIRSLSQDQDTRGHDASAASSHGSSSASRDKSLDKQQVREQLESNSMSVPTPKTVMGLVKAAAVAVLVLMTACLALMPGQDTIVKCQLRQGREVMTNTIFSPQARSRSGHLMCPSEGLYQTDDKGMTAFPVKNVNTLPTGLVLHDEVTRADVYDCLLYTSPSPRDATLSRMPSSA